MILLRLIILPFLFALVMVQVVVLALGVSVIWLATGDPYHFNSGSLPRMK